jgi:hypothetical protein
MRMDSLVIPWVLSGVSIAFLVGCVEYNRRTGFKKVRSLESPLDEALLWINSTRNSLSAVSASSVSPSTLPASKVQEIAMAEASTQQLIRLYAAYNPAPAKKPSAPAKVPADVVGEYALAHVGSV